MKKIPMYTHIVFTSLHYLRLELRWYEGWGLSIFDNNTKEELAIITLANKTYREARKTANKVFICPEILKTVLTANQYDYYVTNGQYFPEDEVKVGAN